jgi:hypothetical protein
MDRNGKEEIGMDNCVCDDSFFFFFLVKNVKFQFHCKL